MTNPFRSANEAARMRVAALEKALAEAERRERIRALEEEQKFLSGMQLPKEIASAKYGWIPMLLVGLGIGGGFLFYVAGSWLLDMIFGPTYTYNADKLRESNVGFSVIGIVCGGFVAAYVASSVIKYRLQRASTQEDAINAVRISAIEKELVDLRASPAVVEVSPELDALEDLQDRIGTLEDRLERSRSTRGS
ncbi:MAG: hypothetical protein IPK60_11805 [Sandaracinaceae bacterium]|nr:hypothetical protein [Sandaracinaceae bacterium]